ncbi:hypothetical protein CA85_21280 [Allorhodopirellula solitaria]|uniref:Uncharacterized protein n=1 Tax=Allorhodopirellula solitaria TaxID=2527987 RepID=A0A5C5XX57_9BACT|nr:hypothetical protein CA85_21280 [Allorhodopirellula solitaria]
MKQLSVSDRLRQIGNRGASVSTAELAHWGPPTQDQAGNSGRSGSQFEAPGITNLLGGLNCEDSLTETDPFETV